jgi:Tfp pilus assembly protein PilV
MRARAGFTLVEVVVALTILMVVMLALITMTGRTVHVSTTSDREQAAIQLATDRTDLVRTDPSYADLDSNYTGEEDSFPTLPGFTRTTVVAHDTTDGHDYKVISVTVDGPGLNAPVTRTVTVAAP